MPNRTSRSGGPTLFDNLRCHSSGLPWAFTEVRALVVAHAHGGDTLPADLDDRTPCAIRAMASRLRLRRGGEQSLWGEVSGRVVELYPEAADLCDTAAWRRVLAVLTTVCERSPDWLVRDRTPTEIALVIVRAGLDSVAHSRRGGAIPWSRLCTSKGVSASSVRRWARRLTSDLGSFR